MGERLRFLQNAMGGVAGPFDAWLTLRGIKTLAVRMDRHCANARAIVEMLSRHPAVARCSTRACRIRRAMRWRPGRCATSAGWCRSGCAAGETAALEVCGRTRLFTLAESLGGVESLIEHPGRMTHASVAGQRSRCPPISSGSRSGIEDAADLVADLEQALG